MTRRNYKEVFICLRSASNYFLEPLQNQLNPPELFLAQKSLLCRHETAASHQVHVAWSSTAILGESRLKWLETTVRLPPFSH